MNIFRKSIGCLSALVLMCPMEAWAVQQHGGAEGLVSHQIGHSLFVAGIAYLLFKIYQAGMKGDGWLKFKIFLWLIVAWNLLTFSGHWMREIVDPAKFSKLEGKVVSFQIDCFADAYFYLTRLDHLLLVPAFFFLYLSLRKWGQKE